MKFYEVRSERWDFNLCWFWAFKALMLPLYLSRSPNFYSNWLWPYCGKFSFWAITKNFVAALDTIQFLVRPKKIEPVRNIFGPVEAKALYFRYASTYSWLDKLGQAALHNYKVVIRQTFYHGCYAMIGEDLNPNPDFWISALYKKCRSCPFIQILSRFFLDFIQI